MHADYLWIIGGFYDYDYVGSFQLYTNSIQKLYIADIENRNDYQWKELPDTFGRNEGTRAVALHDYIYVLGGYGYQYVGSDAGAYI